MREYRSPDGLNWKVVVKLPSHSSAMLIFQHPDGRSSAGDRYAWLNVSGATALNPRERLQAKSLLDSLTDADLARLFRRSMQVSANRELVHMT
jgi:hypothetical protein